MATAAKKTAKAPAKSLGDRLDELWNMREKRRLLDAESKAIKKEEDALEEELIVELKKVDVTGVRGKLASVSINTVSVPQVDAAEWNDFFAWVGRTKNWQMLQKRISDNAVREGLQLGKKIPGVKMFDKDKLSLLTVNPK